MRNSRKICQTAQFLIYISKSWSTVHLIRKGTTRRLCRPPYAAQIFGTRLVYAPARTIILPMRSWCQTNIGYRNIEFYEEKQQQTLKNVLVSKVQVDYVHGYREMNPCKVQTQVYLRISGRLKLQLILGKENGQQVPSQIFYLFIGKTMFHFHHNLHFLSTMCSAITTNPFKFMAVLWQNVEKVK